MATPRRSRTGMVVATLVNETTNHLTLITSNQAPWMKIRDCFEDADRERVAHPPLALEGLTRQQGEELIRLRLESNGAGKMLGAMLDGEWLGREFATDRDRRGTRRFLQLCKERWEELRHRPPPTAATLAHLYEERRRKLLADPKRLLFDADALEWLVKRCADGLPDVTIHPGGTGHFTVGWETPKQRVLFGFEAGSNWKRWGSIARHAGDRAAASWPLKAVLFRDATQPPIPGPTWKVAGVINAAKLEHLHLIVLTRDDLAALYAGYDLYFEALGGDIAPHTAEEVLAFLRETFAQWWQRFAGPLEGDAATVELDLNDEQQLAAQVRAIIAQQKSLSVDELLTRLRGHATPDDVLKVCRYTAAIRIHVLSDATVLQWQDL